MEFVEGQSLRVLLKKVGKIPLYEGLKIIRQVLTGVREAHVQNVIHRDLKPENILIGKDGAVKVMDFGIARSLDRDTTLTGRILGTPAYMSPEQAEGNAADVRSDIYSIGLIMYEMFTGESAFKGDNPISVALKQIREVP